MGRGRTVGAGVLAAVTALAVVAGVGGPARASGRVRATARAAAVASAPAGWRVVAAAASDHDIVLNSVSCSSASACTTVGSDELGPGSIGSAGPEAVASSTGAGRSGLAAVIRAADAAARTSLLRRLGAAGPVGSTPGSTASAARTGSDSAVVTAGKGAGSAVAERWNGVRWTLEPTPAFANAAFVSLDSVSCPSATLCMAIGSRTGADRNGQLRPIAERWNGSHWGLVALPAGGPAISSISCPTTTSCVAVGTDVESGSSSMKTRQIAERWDGASWRLISLAGAPLGSLPFLDAVSCPSVADCTVAGTITRFHISAKHFRITEQPDAQHWGGRVWTNTVLPTPAHATQIDINSISCSAGRDCAAVGDMLSNRQGAVYHPLVEHWDGRLWRHQVGTHPGALLDGVSCVAADTCTTVGLRIPDPGGLSVVGRVTTWAERTSGLRWTVETTPTGPKLQRAFSDVSCTTSDCVAVGATSTGALIEMRPGPG